MPTLKRMASCLQQFSAQTGRLSNFLALLTLKSTYPEALLIETPQRQCFKSLQQALEARVIDFNQMLDIGAVHLFKVEEVSSITLVYFLFIIVSPYTLSPYTLSPYTLSVHTLSVHSLTITVIPTLFLFFIFK